MSPLDERDLREAREIAIALCGHGPWRDGWIEACRSGAYDDSSDVCGPLLGIKIGRGLRPDMENDA